MNIKNFLLILYTLTGIALIGMGLFKKIKVFEGEIIEKLKELQIINTISSIIFGIIFIIEAYFCYLNRLHWSVLIISIIIVEFFQQMLYKHYIKIDDVKKNEESNELANSINLDEIMNDDFFDKKQQEEELKIKEYQEQQQKHKEESIKVLAELLQEGISLGILTPPKEQETINKKDNIINIDFKK